MVAGLGVSVLLHHHSFLRVLNAELAQASPDPCWQGWPLDFCVQKEIEGKIHLMALGTPRGRYKEFENKA